MAIALLVTGACISSVSNGQAPAVNYNVYYGSLHNHTAVSDGKGTPDDAYKYARYTANLDFFGLAEHSNMMSSTEWNTIKTAANKYNEEGVFASFYGFEWTTFWSYGHVAVVQTEDYCSTSSPTSTFAGLLAWVNARNGIAFFNHPGWDPLAYREFNKFTDPPSNKFVGMELWNDKDGFSKYYYNDGFYSNDGGLGYFDEALARGWKIGAAGADDNHTATWGTATDYRVGVLATTLSRASILDAFRERRFFATLDKNISLSFTINGSEMGSTTTGGNCTFEIRATDGNGEYFSQVVLLKKGIKDREWYPDSSNPVITGDLTCADGDYFYVKVRQADFDEAISSPIFISGTVNQPPVVSLSSPADGAIFGTGQAIVVSATADDPDGTVAKVEFYEGGTKIGESTGSPYQVSWSSLIPGSYTITARAYDNLGAQTTSASVTIQLDQQGSTIVSAKISSGKDDAEEYLKGAVYLNDLDIDLVYDSKTSGNQTVGLLFRDLAIPPGAVITSAYIQFACKSGTSGKCSLTLNGEASDNPADFAATSKNISSRPKTVAAVTWKPLDWVADEAGEAQKTPDLKAVVQEIVNRNGWVSGNDMAIIIRGSGTRIAESFDRDAAKAATLTVEYSAPMLKHGLTEAGAGNLSTEGSSSPGGFVLFPNPVSTQLNIQMNGEFRAEKISIISLAGIRVKEMEITGDSPLVSVDCSTLIPGIYLVRIENATDSFTSRFVKR